MQSDGVVSGTSEQSILFPSSGQAKSRDVVDFFKLKLGSRRRRMQ